jgi:predicted nucleic acid-binding protein
MAAKVCCDTSFLYSLYGRDTHTPRVTAAVKHLPQPLTFTVLNEFELMNAMQFRVFRQMLSVQDAGIMFADFEEDKTAGKLVLEHCNLADVIVEAKKLSTSHAAIAGHRSFDILHVAAAVCLKADTFCTLDLRQRRLALAAGLKAWN